MFKDKKVLVTGGTGLVGRELSLLLYNAGAKVRVASLDQNNLQDHDIEVYKSDLRDINNCRQMCKGMDYIFHVAGIKGSPILVKQQPYIFFRDFLQMNTNMIAAMNECPTMQWGTYVSTVGTYGESEIFREEELWDKMPSKNDWFAGWAKRMGEVQIDAYEKQYGIRKISILKPVNIYGSYDNFDLRTSTMVPSFVRKIADCRDQVEIWGDGSSQRDIIHSRDVARALIHAVQCRIKEPINVGNGVGVTIEEVITTLIRISGRDIKVVHDLTKPTGDAKRIADVTRLRSYGFKSTVSLEDGLRETYEWYNNNKGLEVNRFNPFDL